MSQSSTSKAGIEEPPIGRPAPGDDQRADQRRFVGHVSSDHGHDGDAATGSTSWASGAGQPGATAIRRGRAPIDWSPPAAIAPDQRRRSGVERPSATVPVSARRKTPAAATGMRRRGLGHRASEARTARPCASSDPMASSQRPSTSRKFRNRPDGSWTASSR